MKGTIRWSGTEKHYFVDGKEVSQEEFDKAFPPAESFDGSALVGWKPLHSEALAVHPLDVPEATEDARKKGVPTEYDGAGRPIFTSRKHRSNFLRAYGYFDKGAGYGDPAPGSFRR